MEPRKIQSKKRYLLSFMIGTIIFLGVFLLTNFLSNIELKRMDSITGTIAQDIFKDKLIYSFFNESECSEESFGKISRDLAISGNLINHLEEKLGKTDRNVLRQKETYTLILLEHLEFLKDYNIKCNAKNNNILFFYSNEDSKIQQSERVGRVLDVLGNKYPKLSIYSFDINLDVDLIKKLLEKYNISQAPSVLIDEKILLTEITSSEDIEKYLKE